VPMIEKPYEFNKAVAEFLAGEKSLKA